MFRQGKFSQWIGRSNTGLHIAHITYDDNDNDDDDDDENGATNEEVMMVLQTLMNVQNNEIITPNDIQLEDINNDNDNDNDIDNNNSNIIINIIILKILLLLLPYHNIKYYNSN